MAIEKNTELELGRGASLPERSKMPEDYKWRLEDIYPSQEKWEEAFAALKARLPEISAFKGTLAESPAQLAKLFALRDELSTTLGKLFVYANMKSHSRCCGCVVYD